MKGWEEAKTHLNEEAKRTAKLLLNCTDFRPEGREIPFTLKPGVGAQIDEGPTHDRID
jgi:hypothetical protein